MSMTLLCPYHLLRRQRLGIESESQMRSYVEAGLTAALEGSRFAVLNQRKTCVTVLEDGHRITGIRVTQNTVG